MYFVWICKNRVEDSMYKKLLFIFLIITSVSPLFSQTTFNRQYDNRLYTEAFEKFQQGHYSAARVKFEEYLEKSTNYEQIAEARFYQAYCAMQLFNQDAESLFESYVLDYPMHKKAIYAYFELGNFYFRNEQYVKAISSYEKVKLQSLDEEDVNVLKFRLGYSHFNNRDLEKALPEFIYSAQVPNPYQGAAGYYAGFISLELKDYENAFKYLSAAEENEEYKQVIPFYLTKVYYDQGKLDEVISYAEPKLEMDPGIKNRSEMQLMLADAYFGKKEYRTSYDFFEKGIAKSSAHDAEVYYRAGFTAYESGYFEESVDYLKKAALSDSESGQYASYYLGMAYIRLDKKDFARSAFENASKKEFSKDVQFEALFNLGKIDFESGKYQDALAALTSYRDVVKNGDHKDEVYELISESYLRTDDVETAIQYIESLDSKTDKVRSVYQKVTFKQAVALFNAGRYYESVQMFERSLENPLDQSIMLDAYFWMGEAYSIGKRWEDALSAYRRVLSGDKQGNSIAYIKTQYGIGYVYFNLKKYDQALGHFGLYVERVGQRSNKRFYLDALLRLADCNYVTKRYAEAVKIYRRAIEQGNPEPDYCLYQIGLISAIEGNQAAAEQNLNQVINRYKESIYYDDALFQIGQVTFENGNYQQAIERFTFMMEAQPQSTYVPQALVNRAISFYNLKEYNKAIDDYQRVINVYPRHPVANSALLSLQEALAVANRSDEFDAYLGEYKAANPEDKALSNIEFESAKNQYFNQNYRGAVNSFDQFLEDYPGSPFENEVYYFRGESYYRLENYPEALEDLLMVLEDDNSKWFGRTLNRVAFIYGTMQDHEKAITFYHRLLAMAGNRREEYDALDGLMQAHYQLSNDDSTILYGKQILEKGAFSANAQNRTQLILGKAFLAKGDRDNAIDYFLLTVNTAKDVFAAESQYLIAGIYRNEKDYSRSNEALFNLNNTFGLYEEWIGRSFLMIADNYIDMDELFQAKATLNSIIEKSPYEEIKSDAKKKLSQIESLESEIIAVPDSSLIQESNQPNEGND